MKRYAYNNIQIKNHPVAEGPFVVVFDDDGKMIEYHLLVAEEPMTEWIGGTLQIS